MTNAIVEGRLSAIQNLLMEVHRGGRGSSSSSKGRERESFIDLVLSNVIPPSFRVGTGDITDVHGERSGQLDIVIEYGGSLSFPLFSGVAPRLYLAESVCAVVEVKSDLMGQWSEVQQTAEALHKLQRDAGATATVGRSPTRHVPLFAVGYQGWKGEDTVAAKVAEAGLDGALVIGSGVFCARSVDGHGTTRTTRATGPWALYGLLLEIESLISSLLHAKPMFAAYYGGWKRSEIFDSAVQQG
ncbi:DUF6602 domain-containing protein [Reyranella sp. CPCC 100927]|uniref:DUF6602 domain-containing protein n=1 Tax=Reyranella sp. CPCC 100927 TaxID=2599616 RepID=UPI0011B7B865|nr:DUF6602 domain-containing protein [Reyranella sp. CPCC 100927]TWT10638.1 hypothetical protein FQU96_16090 [Reyranella sp. CPCC 100927]